MADDTPIEFEIVQPDVKVFESNTPPVVYYQSNYIPVGGNTSTVSASYAQTATSASWAPSNASWPDLTGTPDFNSLGMAWDDINRADDPDSPGTATVGGDWTSLVGGWGIINNQLYTSAPVGGDICLLGSTLNGSITSVVSAGAYPLEAPGIVFRVEDQNNYFYVDITAPDGNAVMELVSVTNGSPNVLQSLAFPAGFINGQLYTLRVDFQDGLIQTFIDSGQFITWNLSASDLLNTGTGCGVRNGSQIVSTQVRFHSFQVTPFKSIVANTFYGDVVGNVATSTSASYAAVAQVALNVPVTASYAQNADHAQTAGISNSASVATSATVAGSALTAISASYAPVADTATSASVAVSASYSAQASHSIVADRAVISDVATTASFATIAAHALLADQAAIATSASYSTVAQDVINAPASASHALVADVALNVPATASFAVSASVAVSASYAPQTTQVTASYALTAQTLLGTIVSASHANVADTVLGSIVSASFAATASYFNGAVGTVATASYALVATSMVSGSLLGPTSASDNFTVAKTVSAAGVSANIVSATNIVVSNTLFAPTASITGPVTAASFTGNGAGITGVISASVASTASSWNNVNGGLLSGIAGSPFVPAAIISASYSVTASYALNGGTGGSSVSASFATTASVSQNIALVNGGLQPGIVGSATFPGALISASYSVSASLSARVVSSSYALTASYALNGGSGGSSVTSSYALTIPRTVIVNVSGSYTASLTDQIILVSASLGTASILLPAVNQTAGQSYLIRKTDSGAFPVLLIPSGANTIDGISGVQILSQHAQVAITSNGGNTWLAGNAGFYSGSIAQAVSASFALSASWAPFQISASYAQNAGAANTATSASYAPVQVSASYATNASTATTAITASYVLNAVSASYAPGSGASVSSSYAVTASFATSASYAPQVAQVSSSYALSASYAPSSPSISASYAGNASTANNATSASYALTASYALNGGSGGSSNGVFGGNFSGSFSGSVAITGSLVGSASYASLAPAYFPATGGIVLGTVSASSMRVGTSTWAANNTLATIVNITSTTGAGFSYSSTMICGQNSLPIQWRVSSIDGAAFMSIFGEQIGAGALRISGSANINKDLNVTGSVTASAYTGNGAAITGVISSSYSLTASYALNGGTGGTSNGVFGGAFSGSFSGSLTGSLLGNPIGTSSYATVALLANVATSASFATNAIGATTAQSASYVLQAVSASYAPGGAGSATASYCVMPRLTQTFTASSQTTNTIYTGSVVLGAEFIAYQVSASADSRLRLYNTTASLFADISRSLGTTPSASAGCLLDVAFIGSQKVVNMAPAVVGFSAELVPTDNIAWAITNLSGSAVATTIQITYKRN